MPHGLTVDDAGAFWIADVALHQVVRVDAHTLHASLVLGESGVPGADDAHFCQPAAVAVATGDKGFFVADGYCNARVVKYTSDGRRVGSFGRATKSVPAAPGELSVPHALALVEERDLLCVADRENERVQCVNAGLHDTERFGRFQFAVEVGGRAFGLDYNEASKCLFFVLQW